MRRAVTLGLLTLIFGCTEAPNETHKVDSPSHEATLPLTSAPIDLSSPNGPTVADYPEKTEVQRLLSRAAQLEADGKFQEALAIVSEALAVDANSPRATTCKQRLEELIRRI